MAQNPFEKALADEGLVGTPLESLARSIYMQESSSGQNTKTSNAGAVGGMQILPGTFNEVLPGGNINDPYDNSRAGLRYIKQMYDKSGGDLNLTAAGYYGGPGGMQKAKQGVAVRDPRNPNAPTTLEYAKQVTERQGKNVSRGTPKAIQENIANLGEGYQAAYALMSMADEEPETEREIEAREAAEEQSAAQQFSALKKQLLAIKPATPFADQEPQQFNKGGEATAEDEELTYEELTDEELTDEEKGIERKLAERIGLAPAWDAAERAPAEMGFKNDAGTKGDAVRHMMLMRGIEQKYGPYVAKAMGYAHEAGNIFDPSNNLFKPEGRAAIARNWEMDTRNNALGLELSKQAGGDEAKFKELVKKALEDKQADYYAQEYSGTMPISSAISSGNFNNARKMLKEAMSGQVRKRAGGSPEMGEVSGRTFEEGGPETAKRMLKDVARGMSYYPYDLVGAPVDVINLGLKGIDWATGSKLATDKPVGGSEYLIEKSRQMGIAGKPTGSAAEELARFASAFINPAAAARATGRVLEKTGKLGKDVLEDLSMATTGQGGSKMAQLATSQAQPSFAVPPGEAKKALQQLDLNMIKPTAESPFVGRLEQLLFDNPQEVFNPQQLLGWGKKTLRGSDADRLEEALKPLMGEKKLTKQQVLEQVNQTFSPKRFTIETTAVNEPIRGNTFISTYMGDDFPYKVDNVKKLGTIVARKPSNLNVDQLRLEGALDSVITHPEATEAYIRGIDTEVYNNNLNNIQMYLKEMPLDKANKEQAAQLFNEFTTSTRELANRNYLSDLHRDYNKTKFDMDEQERLQNIQKIAESLGIDTQLMRLPELENEVNTALNLSQRALIKEKAKQDTEMMEFFLEKMSPKQAQFFRGRAPHEFQGANAISFSRYVDIPVGDKNLIGVSEYQSDLRRHLKKGLDKTKSVTDIEVYPNMVKRDDELKQNMIKNIIYGAAKMEKDGVVLPGMMSKKAVLYTDVAKQAKVALKDLGLDTKNIKKINAEQVYDKQKLEYKLVEMYSGMIDTKEANRIFSVKDIPEEIKLDLIQQLSPYVVYLPKKDRSKILQTGIPYAKGGLVEKKY